MKKKIKKLFFKIIGKPQWNSSEDYINYIKSKGIKIGNGCLVLSPREIRIDTTRPELISIGDNVFLHRGTVIQSHDWASWTFVKRYNDFIPSHGKIKIGNNVWLGENVTILKNVIIGDNVIIGAGSLVTRSIPSNSVAVGRPAKVIGNLDDYYEKRKSQYIKEVLEYAIAIYESGRTPNIEDFQDDYPIFVDGTNYTEYNYPYDTIFTPEQFEKWIKNHKAPYAGFDEFMKFVELSRHKNNSDKRL